jgi:hypothetical protein
MTGGVPYPHTHKRHNRMSTYGVRGLFGGWIFERNHKAARLRMRRTWRKQARREGKQWIAEWSES